MIEKHEFIDWKNSEVTKLVFQIVQNRIDEIKDNLSVNAGLDSQLDRFYVGMAHAFKEVLEIDFIDTGGSEDA